jgi:formylglycine-generating enzyme required for sulfatase activity
VYRYSHLTFQEYLAALAVAARDDYIPYTLERSGESSWREVIRLEAGHLSMQSRDKTTRLIQAIAERKEEPEPYYNLVLAADCLRDVGPGRVDGNSLEEVQSRLRTELETRAPQGTFGSIRVWLSKGMTAGELTRRRIAAAQALASIHGAVFWTLPYGEPEWVQIPAGEFWMGTREQDIPELMNRYGGERDWYEWEVPQHKVPLPAYAISRTPITNAQYRLYVDATGHEPPEHWEEGRPPKGKETHPVVNVTWHDAMDYCGWLSAATGKTILLPSEAEWEKAARGDEDRRSFPWGDTFDATWCNSQELGLGETTPTGTFPHGASPYGCLDMSGNVWEWTRSLWGKNFAEPEFKYPYDPTDGREELQAGNDVFRVLRGGSFNLSGGIVRCASRLGSLPDDWGGDGGFRVCVAPGFPSDL